MIAAVTKLGKELRDLLESAAEFVVAARSGAGRRR